MAGDLQELELACENISANWSDVHCESVWDDGLCWLPTPVNQSLTLSCGNASSNATGNATRWCSENATWEIRNVCYTNDDWFMPMLGSIKFYGSVLSLAFLLGALFIFLYFKNLRNERVKVHCHLMSSLVLRNVMDIIILEPLMSRRDEMYTSGLGLHNYKEQCVAKEALCKAFNALMQFISMSGYFWMFIEGLHLHLQLSVGIHNAEAPFKLYYAIGWGIPAVMTCVWAVVMEMNPPPVMDPPLRCWSDYHQRSSFWIIVASGLAALLANVAFLVNIVRILVIKLRINASTFASSEAEQFKKACKATVVLAVLLGVPHLLLPMGQSLTYTVFVTFLNVLEGVLISILYCYANGEVRSILFRAYRRFRLRRQSMGTRRSGSGRPSSAALRRVSSRRTRPLEEGEAVELRACS